MPRICSKKRIKKTLEYIFTLLKPCNTFEVLKIFKSF